MIKWIIITIVITLPSFGSELSLIAMAKEGLKISSKYSLKQRTGITTLDAVNEKYCCKTFRPMAQNKWKSKSAAENIGLDRLYFIELNCKTDNLSHVIDAYMRTGHFEFVEVDTKMSASYSYMKESFFPNDLWIGQWYLHNEAQDPFLTPILDVDIDMPEAWGIEQGDSSVIIAILDSGIKGEHPDFEGRLWVNEDEIPGNGIDDDGNGRRDDVNGWNFVDGNNNIDDDAVGHGTAVASIIGASTDNGIGYAGVNGKSKLMILKIANSAGEMNFSNFFYGVHYAIENGARVINCSYAGPTFLQAEELVVRYADSCGVLICSGTGNNNTDSIYYPAKHGPVISVGATNPLDQRWTVEENPSIGSNYGDSLDVVAPGEYILCIQYNTIVDSLVFINREMRGTSFATALVSGLASLLVSQNPDITPAQVRHIITTTAEDQVGDEYDTPGYDKYYGHGRINAYQALLLGKEMMETKQSAQNPAAQNSARMRMRISWSAPARTLRVTGGSLSEASPVDITIVNAQGRALHQTQTRPVDGTVAVTVPQFGAGVYFYRVRGSGMGKVSGRMVFR